VLLLVFTGLYIAVGRKTRQLAQQELQARREQLARLEEQGEAPSAGEAPLEAPAVLQRISAEDLQAIQSIFGLDTFFVTETVPYGEGAIFKGNLRQEAEVVVPLLVEKLKEQVGSRYQLFLVEDPAEKPAVVVLPDPIVNYRASVGAQILAGALLVFSFVATLEVGANLLGFRLLDAPGAGWKPCRWRPGSSPSCWCMRPDTAGWRASTGCASALPLLSPAWGSARWDP
jgi:hypothetical protein